MSVNRFLYATNFVVNAPANRPAGPLVKVSNNTEQDVFKIRMASTDSLARDLTEINGDLTGKGEELGLFYTNSTVSGSNIFARATSLLTVSGPSGVFNLGSTTVSGDNMLLDQSDVMLKASHLLTVSGPSGVFNLGSTTVSGVDMLLDQSDVMLKASHLLTVSGPSGVFNLGSTTVSGVNMLVDQSDVMLKASTLLTVSGPTAVFNLGSTTVSGDNMTVNEKMVNLTASQSLMVNGPLGLFNIANTSVFGNSMLVDEVNDVNFKNENFNIKDRADKTIVHVDTRGMVIDGMLVVKGDMTTVNSNEVLIGDSHITLNAQHITNTQVDGGITVVNRALLSVALSGFKASTAMNQYEFTLVGASSATREFPANAILQLSGATKDGHNGYYKLGATAVSIDQTATTFTALLEPVADSTIFLKPANITIGETGLTDCYLSHVEISDIRMNAEGEVHRAFGNLWPLEYVSFGNTYENKMPSPATGLLETYKIAKSVTVCYPHEANSDFKLNLRLPPVTLGNRGAEYKVINKQNYTMSIYAHDDVDTINNYSNGIPYHILYPGNIESTSVSFMAYYFSETDKGWQII